MGAVTFDPSTSTHTPGVDDTNIREPSDRKLRRLAVDTAEYLGIEYPGLIPLNEVREQARANGYSDPEIESMLAEDGLLGSENVRLPPRGDLFGELWQAEGPTPERSVGTEPAELTPDVGAEPALVGAGDYFGSEPSGPESDPQRTSTDVETLRKWLQEKVEKDALNHAYSRKTAGRRFCRDKDVGRFFVDNYDRFSTVLITYCLDRRPGEGIAEHAKRFYPQSVRDARRECLGDLGVYSEFAGVSVLAPKHAPDRAGSETTEMDRVRYSADGAGAVPTTHGHDFIRAPGDIDESDFGPLKDACECVGFDVDIRIETHKSAEVSTPESVLERGSGFDRERGDTTALAQEFGNNLPMLRTKLDARGLSDYAERWAAAIRLGVDKNIETSGIRTYRPIWNGQSGAKYDDYADEIRAERRTDTKLRIRQAVRAGAILADRIDWVEYGTPVGESKTPVSPALAPDPVGSKPSNPAPGGSTAGKGPVWRRVVSS